MTLRIQELPVDDSVPEKEEYVLVNRVVYYTIYVLSYSKGKMGPAVR